MRGTGVRRARPSLAAGALGALAVGLTCHGAHAQSAVVSAKGDPTVGRIEGDLGLVLGVGSTIGPRGPRASVDGRVRYLDTAGLFVGYEDAAVWGSWGSPEPARVLSFGLELRPLFMARWLNDAEWGRPRLDLLVDSLGLELGAYFYQDHTGPLVSLPGLQAGVGVEVPLLARATGPWIGLHGGLRWGQRALAEEGITGPDDRAAFLTITIAYHAIVRAHVIDVADEAHR